MNTIKIYGASDDLVEIDGDLREEFDVSTPKYLLFNDGTQVKVEYGEDGVWHVNDVTRGAAQWDKALGLPDDAPKKQCHGDPDAPSYSDVVILVWDKPFKLVKHGSKKLSAPLVDEGISALVKKVISVIENTRGGEYFLHEIDGGEDGNEDTYEDFEARLAQALSVKPAPKSSVSGHVFAITGTLSMSREETKGLIESRGGEVASSVSSRVNFLVCGDEPGSKLDKARELGIPELNEAEFLKLLS